MMIKYRYSPITATQSPDDTRKLPQRRAVSEIKSRKVRLRPNGNDIVNEIFI